MNNKRVSFKDKQSSTRTALREQQYRSSTAAATLCIATL